MNKLVICIIALLFSNNSACFAKKPKHGKHEFRISNIGAGNSLMMSQQETYFAYFINPSFLDNALEHWQNKVDSKLTKAQAKKKFKTDPDKLKQELKKPKYQRHHKASWEDPNKIVVVVAPSVRFEDNTFRSDEYHSNVGEVLNSKIINKKTLKPICRPSSMQSITGNWDYNYLKHVYGGWDLESLIGSLREGFPFDLSLPLTVFKYDPKCFKDFKKNKHEFILETDVGDFDTDLGKYIIQEIEKDFNL